MRLGGVLPSAIILDRIIERKWSKKAVGNNWGKIKTIHGDLDKRKSRKEGIQGKEGSRILIIFLFLMFLFLVCYKICIVIIHIERRYKNEWALVVKYYFVYHSSCIFAFLLISSFTIVFSASFGLYYVLSTGERDIPC